MPFRLQFYRTYVLFNGCLKNGLEVNHSDILTLATRPFFLQIFISNSLRAGVNVVYFQAGAETTSTTLLWWAFYLSISLTFGPRGELVGEKQDKKSTFLMGLQMQIIDHTFNFKIIMRLFSIYLHAHWSLCLFNLKVQPKQITRCVLYLTRYQGVQEAAREEVIWSWLLVRYWQVDRETGEERPGMGHKLPYCQAVSLQEAFCSSLFVCAQAVIQEVQRLSCVAPQTIPHRLR